MELLRDRVGSHLKRCNAYLIQCNFCWNRSFVSMIAKRYFKRVAKGLEDGGSLMSKTNGVDADISMTLRDQVPIKYSFVIRVLESNFCLYAVLSLVSSKAA